ncbi:hypothetical protein [Flagellimonas sp.]|uniref:hypothetical protein n=1 Tax=Flagellimonas sp. TaxID=2058762 RepID=UPI003F4A3D33
MILGFRTQWPEKMVRVQGKLTRFPQKIAKSIPLGFWWEWPGAPLMEKYFVDRPPCTSDRPKIHSIRDDVNKRWKPGRAIHFYINTRTPNMLQIAPPVPCISVQEFEICDDEAGCEIACSEPYFRVDGRILGYHEMENLAHNDGFVDVYTFLKWFRPGYKGRIIHWTHFKY